MIFLKKKGTSLLEYIALFIIIISAFVVMRPYIQHGIHGNWAKTGQAFAYGRQWDSQKSIECAYDDISNKWYDRNCFDYSVSVDGCNGNLNCEENIITNKSCQASGCNQLNNG